MSNLNAEETIPFGRKEPRSGTVWTVGKKGKESPAPALKLVMLPGRQVFDIRQPEVIVGRHANVDLQLLQPDISRRHCRLFCAANQWCIEDLESLNGTLVNGEYIESIVLHANDLIRIGGQLFQVEMAAAEMPSTMNDLDAERSQNVLRDIAALLPETDSVHKRRKSA